MITKISEYKNRQIPSSDLCIVGTGPAGMELARNFVSTGLSVTLLESGYEDFNEQIQRLSRFQQAGRPIRCAEELPGVNDKDWRKQQYLLRRFGGLMNIWGGKWKALHPIDFDKKPGIIESGWPIPYSTLYTYYESAAKSYEVAELLHVNKNPIRLPLLPYQHDCFSPSIYIKQDPPLDFIGGFHQLLISTDNIRLILGATAVEIRLSENLSHVEKVIVRSIEGGEWIMKSKCFVLACGAIENARLLLASNRQAGTGVGNANDLVGRNFIEHPHGIVGRLELSGTLTALAEAAVYKVGPKRFGFGLSINPAQLKDEQLPHHCLYLTSKTAGETSYPVKIDLEQYPNFESRVCLSSERDELGMLKACLDWKFKELDYDGLKRFIEKMRLLFSLHSIGALTIDESLFDMKSLKDLAHPMGTTRMALNRENGVVDSNCKVFDIDNLYIAGASVFPVSGNANPTFTIIALSRRLADHLKVAF